MNSCKEGKANVGIDESWSSFCLNRNWEGLPDWWGGRYCSTFLFQTTGEDLVGLKSRMAAVKTTSPNWRSRPSVAAPLAKLGAHHVRSASQRTVTVVLVLQRCVSTYYLFSMKLEFNQISIHLSNCLPGWIQAGVKLFSSDMNEKHV